MKQRFLHILFFLLLPLVGLSTHNRSGSIVYKHLYGTTYEFTVTTCTKTSSEADRPLLEIDWGDNTSDTLTRADIEFNTSYDVQKNIYIGTHTFTGPDSYIISVEDPNRNASVINITNSVDKVFCIQTELIISPFIGTPNNSLIIEDCPCPEFACQNQIYCYNISAFDPDGDSLSYALVPCRGEACLEMAIPEIYQYPNEIAGGTISIDPITGTLCWDSPELIGIYNIAIKVSEYRNGFYVGSVLQDMQFDVRACSHIAPEITPVADTCVYSGTMLDIPLTATDSAETVTIFATGAIFNLANNPAIFSDSTGFMTATGHFLWNPTCVEARDDHYNVTVHAEDDNSAIQLTDIFNFRIKVNIPPVENLSVLPTGNAMTLGWDASVCDNIIRYNVYRSLDSVAYVEDCCEKGTPEALGYSLIGTSAETDYIDMDNLIVGNEYCYLVTAVSENGTESCVSEQICNHLNFEIPVLTNVSIVSTDVTTGTDSIYWAYPKELNTTLYAGPYNYELFRKEGDTDTEELIYTSPSRATIENPDTMFFDTNLNTTDFDYTYRVALYNDGLLLGHSIPSSSIFLTLIPNDNQLELRWENNVPWTNTSYEVYRETSSGSGTFDLIETIDTISYIDTGLVNGVSYCYKIKTIGSYSASGIVSPIINWSQEVCGIPIDLTPPCPPVLAIDGDCDLEETYLSWTNPNNSCADDVTRYNLYFAPFEGDSLTLLTSFDNDVDTFFVHKDRGSIAGCYYVTALDSIQYNNESVPSNIACIDNCGGFYTLPNIFSPDNSGANDLFHPILPFKFVESIDIVIQNRWGEIVFETEDPFIYWDGTNKNTGQKCHDGVYFYQIVVNEIRLEGLVPRSFQGNIQLINGQ